MQFVCLVQFCWEIVGSKGQFHETFARGNHVQDGSVRQRINERQTEGK